MSDYTLVGVFDDQSTAEQVQRDLIAAGFSDVRVSDGATERPYDDTASRTYDTGTEEKGFWESLKDFFGYDDSDDYREAVRRGAVLVTVTADRNRIDDAEAILNRHDPLDIDHQVSQWQAGGYQRPAQETRSADAQGEQAIPIVEEQLRVGKRREQRGGVRVYSHVTETPVEEEVRLRNETVRVTRRAADRTVDGDSLRDQTIEVYETREVPVVSKEARIVGEVVVEKDAEERTEKIRDTVRKTDVQVEDIDESARPDYSSVSRSEG